MRGVTARFVMLIATAAVAPLVVYGVVSILRLESGTKQSVTEGNTRVAKQAAEQIKQYIENNQRVLKSLGVELRAPELQQNPVAGAGNSCPLHFLYAPNGCG